MESARLGSSLARRPVLVVAHPGHELRVHGWLQASRPRVFVLTDGSGRTGVSRLPYTSRVLSQVQAEPGAIYGRFTDQELYQVIMEGDVRAVGDLVEELAAALVDEAATEVVGDAAEGYSPAHDLCRLVINAAVELGQRWRACAIRNLAFSLLSTANGPRGDRDGIVWHDLDETALATKLAAARAYTPLQAEVSAALAAAGPEAFRREHLWRVNEGAGRYELSEHPPFYERYGEQQVAAGRYVRPLRYQEHMVPVAEAIGRHVASSAAL